jgi:hypothetical protein
MKEFQIEFTLTSVKITIIKTPPTTNFGKDVGKKEPSYTDGGNIS